MRLLVTGGCGFIGTNFIRYWHRRHPDDHITNLDKLTYAGRRDNLRELEHCTNYAFVRGDICDTRVLDRLLPGVDCIVHFAAESHVDNSIADDAPFIRTNILGTMALAKAALRHKVARFHHVSTDEVFGDLPLDSKEKFRESTAYDPHNPYSASKAASDHLVRSLAHTHGLPLSVTNCGNNYGPYQHPEKMIPKAILALIQRQKIPVYGRGENIRDWLHVEDHCCALETILASPTTRDLDATTLHAATQGTTYCIGGLTQDVTNLTLVREIARQMGRGDEAIRFVTDRPGHDRKYAVDWSKIRRELGWKPQHDLDSGIDATIEWYIENREWWERPSEGWLSDLLAGLR